MKKLLFIIFILALSTQAQTVLAVDKYTLLEPLPCVSGVGNCTEGTFQTEISFQDYVGYVFKFSIALAVFLAIVVIIYAGFEYMLAEALPTKLDAKKRIRSAITGLLLVFSSYLILRIIDPRLVQIYTEIPPVNFSLDKETEKFLSTIGDQTTYSPSVGTVELSPETKQKIQSASAEITSINNRINELEKKKSTNGTLSSEEVTEIQTLKQKANSTLASVVKIKADDELNSIFFKTINYGDATPEIYSDSQTNINLITTVRSEALRKLGDYTSVQKLASQNDFYNNEIKEQQELSSNLSSKNVNYLKSKMTQYQSKLTDLQTGNDKLTTRIGVDVEKYKQLLIDRMTRINTTLTEISNKK